MYALTQFTALIIIIFFKYICLNISRLTSKVVDKVIKGKTGNALCSSGGIWRGKLSTFAQNTIFRATPCRFDSDCAHRDLVIRRFRSKLHRSFITLLFQCNLCTLQYYAYQLTCKHS